VSFAKIDQYHIEAEEHVDFHASVEFAAATLWLTEEEAAQARRDHKEFRDCKVAKIEVLVTPL
jgi:hypothetical protein